MSVQQYDTIWVFSAGMRRSASTLQYHLARELVEYIGGRTAGWVIWQKFNEVYKELDGSFPVVILKCHAFMPSHSTVADILFKKERAKALTIFREPLDVAASMYMMERENYPEKTWDTILLDVSEALREFTIWSSLPESQCLVQSYEQSSQQLLREIADFLDILYLPAWEKACLERHTLEAHKRIIDRYEGKWDLENLFWHNHISASNGENGRYKERLTSKQITDIETIVENWKAKL